jgi:hypothetical protein
MSKQKKVKVGDQYTSPKTPKSVIGRPAQIRESILKKAQS